MLIGHIEKATRTLGAPIDQPQVVPLAIRDIVYADGTPAVVSAWLPTPKELAALNAGQPVYLAIFGTNMPPCYVGTKEDFP